MSIYSDTTRALFSQAHKKRNEGMKVPETINAIKDIRYGELGDDQNWQLLDLYLPGGYDTEGSNPVIVSVHGGGWVEGDKDEYSFYCMNIASKGYAVINFSYRLAPEYPFPAALEDLGNVLKWIWDTREKYGFDTGSIFGIGDSAGGHILALYTALLTEGEDGKEYPYVFSKIRFRALGLNCASIFLGEYSALKTPSRHSLEDLVGGELTESKFLKLKPEPHITENFPPTFLVSSSRDFLKEQPDLVKSLLDKKGVPCRYRIYGSDEKPLGHCFFLDLRLPESEIAMQDELDFFSII